MNYNLKRKVVIITGGAGLLGKEFVMTVAKNGGHAILADIDEKKGMRALSEIRSRLGSKKVDFIKLDITSAASIDDMIKQLYGKYGKIYALVNNAYPKNLNYGKKMDDISYEDFCENINLHLGGYFLTSQRVGLFFKKQGYGNIINMSSIYGVIAPRFEIYRGTKLTMPVEYAVIKSALIQLTRYMAKYYKGLNIRVNSISPGGIFDDQPSQFLKRYKNMCVSKGILNRSDLNGALIFLLSGMSQYVNGQNIIVDDGFCL